MLVPIILSFIYPEHDFLTSFPLLASSSKEQTSKRSY